MRRLLIALYLLCRECFDPPPVLPLALADCQVTSRQEDDCQCRNHKAGPETDRASGNDGSGKSAHQISAKSVDGGCRLTA